jgi:diguanylate cyclase (GGDEF)-like protein
MAPPQDLLIACLELCAKGRYEEAAQGLALGLSGLSVLGADHAAQRLALQHAQALVRWRLAVQVGRNAQGLSEAIDALEHLRERGHAERLAWCYGSLALSVALAGDLDLALRYTEEGLADARQRGDALETCLRLNGKGAVLAVSDQRAQALQVYAEALKQLPDSPDALATRLLLLNNMAYCELMLARAGDESADEREQRGLRALQHAQAAGVALGEPLPEDWRGAWTLSNTGAALDLLGRSAEAEQAYLRAQQSVRGHHRVALALAANHARLLVGAGRLDEARSLLEPLLGADGDQPLDPTVDDLLEIRMILEIRAGQAEAALRWAAQRFQRQEQRHRLQIATVRRLLGLYQRIEQAQRAEREQAQQQLRFWQDEALRDPLCGVLNRRGLQIASRGLLQPGRLVAVLLLDLDHFKSINDRFGHALGDQVLVQAAQLMQAAIREGDLLARLGGEEFCVLLPGCGPEPAQRLADKLRTRIAEADWSRLDPALGLSVSGGIATGQGEASLDELIAIADQRLYEAKAEGRNRIRA